MARITYQTLSSMNEFARQLADWVAKRHEPILRAQEAQREMERQKELMGYEHELQKGILELQRKWQEESELNEINRFIEGVKQLIPQELIPVPVPEFNKGVEAYELQPEIRYQVPPGVQPHLVKAFYQATDNPHLQFLIGKQIVEQMVAHKPEEFDAQDAKLALELSKMGVSLDTLRALGLFREEEPAILSMLEKTAKDEEAYTKGFQHIASALQNNPITPQNYKTRTQEIIINILNAQNSEYRRGMFEALQSYAQGNEMLQAIIAPFIQLFGRGGGGGGGRWSSERLEESENSIIQLLAGWHGVDASTVAAFLFGTGIIEAVRALRGIGESPRNIALALAGALREYLDSIEETEQENTNESTQDKGSSSVSPKSLHDLQKDFRERALDIIPKAL